MIAFQWVSWGTLLLPNGYCERDVHHARGRWLEVVRDVRAYLPSVNINGHRQTRDSGELMVTHIIMCVLALICTEQIYRAEWCMEHQWARRIRRCAQSNVV